MVFASCASLAQQARATDSDSLAADECLRTAAREGLELSRGEFRDSTTLCLGNDHFGERVLGIAFDGCGTRDQILLANTRRNRNAR